MVRVRRPRWTAVIRQVWVLEGDLEQAVDLARLAARKDRDDGKGHEEVRQGHDPGGRERDPDRRPPDVLGGSRGHVSYNLTRVPRKVTIWTSAFGSLARRRLIWMSIAFDACGSVSQDHACYATAMRSSTAGQSR